MTTRTASPTVTRIIGIVAIVLGVLALIGHFTFSDMVSILGVVLVIAGILILVNVLRGSTVAGVVFLVLGVVLLLGFLPMPSPLPEIIRIVVGIVLIVYGILLVK